MKSQDLAFFQAADCSAASAVPVSDSAVQYLSSFPEAVDPEGHRRAFDEAPGTTWIGNCKDCGEAGDAVGPGPWVGVVLSEEATRRIRWSWDRCRGFNQRLRWPWKAGLG